MLPILFSVGPITIYSFGFLLGIGVFLNAFIVWRRLKELGLKEEKIIDFIIFSDTVALLVSRIFFIAQNFSNFGFYLNRWLVFIRYPGFSFWGGVIGFFLGSFLFIRKQKWDFWQVNDEVVFGLLPLLILIQLGYFLEGSLHGKPTGAPWGMFAPGSLFRQHPVSLFFAILLLVIFLVLRKIEGQWRTWEWYKSKAPGFIFLTFLGSFSFSAFLLAFLKDFKLYFYWLEIIVNLFILLFVILLIWQKSQKGKIILKR